MGAKKILSWIWDYTLLSFGTLIYTVAWVSFMIPNGIADGGVTGACTILEYATGIPVSYSFFIVNSLILILGVIFLGGGFGIKTIYVIVLSSLLFKFLPLVDFLPAVEGKPLYVHEKLLVPVIGGILEALGISIVFKRGGSTGGTDIIALIIDKFYPITPGKVYLVSDLIIITSIILVPGKTFQDMIYGYIIMITFSIVLDWFLLGSKATMQLLVFSSHTDEIADYVAKEMERGVTVVKTVGWYTKKERDVLLILLLKSEVQELTKVIHSIDSKAFVSISDAKTVYGEGFEKMKTGIHTSKKKVGRPSLNH